MAVYHVTDDLENATNLTEDAELADDATDVTIVTDHFSIYTVTVFSRHRNGKNFSFNIQTVNEAFEVIDGDAEVRKVNFSNEDYYSEYGSVASIAPQINGYVFKEAYYGDVAFKYVRVQNNKLYPAADTYSYYKYLEITPDLADGVIKFVYKVGSDITNYTTKDHLDLGFTDEEYKTYHDAKAKVYASINGNRFVRMKDISKDSDLKTYEYRLYLKNYEYDLSVPDEYYYGGSVSIKTPVTFKVVVGNDVYIKESSVDLNRIAYDRCVNSHTYRQNIFGFDYLFSFTEDFSLQGDITYYSNDGQDNKKPISINEDNYNHEVLSYDALKDDLKFVYGSTAFLGWSTDENATTAEEEYTPGNTKVINDGGDIKLYAVWQKYNVSFVDLDDETVKYAADQIVVKGQKVDASKVEQPSKGNDYVFEGWFVKDENGELKEFDFNTTIEKDTIVYAKWSAVEVYVAVYATDGTSNKTENPQLKEKLGLNYVQDDAYYPVGVIKLPSSLFKNVDGSKKSSPYIKNEDDFKKVMDSFKNLDKTKLVRNGAQNNGNTVADNLKYVQYNENGTAGSFKTALFDWNDHEHYDSYNWNRTNIATVDGKNYKYHLDLRFTTNTVKYIGVYPDGKTTDDKSAATKTQTQAYLTSTEVTVPSANDFVLAESDKAIYSVAGFYTDRAMTEEYEAEKAAITSDKVVYVKLVKAEVDKDYTVDFYYQNDKYEYVKMAPTQTLTVKVPRDSTKDGVTVSCVAANESDITKAFDSDTQNNITTYTGAFTKDGVKFIEDKTCKDNVYSGVVKNETGNKVALKVYFKRVVPEGYHVVVNVAYDAEGADNRIMYDGKQHNGNVGVAVTASTSYSTADTFEDTSSDNATNPLVEVANVVIQGFADGAKKLLNLGVLVVSAAETEEDKYVITPVPTAEAVTAGGLTANISGLVVKSEKGTNVGTYDVLLDKSNVKVETVIDGKTVELSNIDVEVLVNGKKLAKAENEIFETSEDKIGILTIYERDVKLTSESYSRAYNGAVLTRPIVQVDGHGFVDGEVENLRATGSVLNAGDRAVNTIVYDPTEKFDEKNYTIEKSEGVLSITASGGDDDDDDDTPGTPTTVVDTPVPAAPAAAVLGATRDLVTPGDAPAVLGARRAGTSDTSILGSVITIIVAAAIAFSMVFIKRKKKEEN